MANPLIDNCPEDPTLAAAYWKGIREACRVEMSIVGISDKLVGYAAELQNHVLRLMRDRETKTNE